MIDDEGFLALETLPQRILMVGGGYIAAEFPHIAARAGAQVVVLQRGERMLANFEPELVGWLMESFRRAGLDVRPGAEVKAVEKARTGYCITATSNGQSVTIEADLVVHAAGRVPNLDRLDLDAAGVALKDGRLQLNEEPVYGFKVRSRKEPNA